MVERHVETQKAPPRSKVFMWSILKNKIPTGDNLIKRGMHKPFWCNLCKDNTESMDHLFLTCPITVDLWVYVLSNIPTQCTWWGQTARDAWTRWWSSAAPAKARNLPLLICWEIWVA